MSGQQRPARHATFLGAALQDVERLNGDDPRLGELALTRIRQLERREIDGVPLQDMAATGDLSDCRKLYFGFGSPPSHRIVYRDLGENGGIEVVEVVAIEARGELYAYLLAADRLKRLPDESKSRFSRVHQQAIAKRAARRPKP